MNLKTSCALLRLSAACASYSSFVILSRRKRICEGPRKATPRKLYSAFNLLLFPRSNTLRFNLLQRPLSFRTVNAFTVSPNIYYIADAHDI